MSPRFSGLPTVTFSAQHIRVYRTSSVLFCSPIQLSLTPVGNADNLYGFISMQFISSQRSPSSKTEPTNQNENNVTATKLIHYTIVKTEYEVNVKKLLHTVTIMTKPKWGKTFLCSREWALNPTRATSSGTTRATDSKMTLY